MLDNFLIIGRLHPLLVHLPIGILALGFLMEVFSRKAKYAYLKPAISFTILMSGLSAVVTVATGWIMPKNGQFDETLLDLHFWFGIGLTVGIFILYALSKGDKSKLTGKLYFPFFIVNLLLLTATGHYGGSLTHGSNYLFESEDEGVLIEGAVEDIKLYKQVIAPLFKKKCNSCHNPGKLKGELLLTTKEGILNGGKNGDFFIPNDAKKSLVMERIDLPKMEKKHMPPKGKVQLTHEEIKMLEWWINEGGDFEKTAGELNPTDEILEILEKYKSVRSQLPTAHLEPLDAKKVNNIRARGIKLNPQDETGVLFEASLAHDMNITRKKLGALKKIADHIVKLNLSFSNLDNDLVKAIKSFRNLQKLDLQQTEITSEGLSFLKKMISLESLNLYGSKLNDESVQHLAALPALKNLYLWQSEISPEAVLALQELKPQLNIYHSIDKSLMSDANLKKPAFLTEQDLFKDSLEIEIDTIFKGVSVFYTMDGSIPDTNSNVYKAPFNIYNTTELKAVAHKAGWKQSDVAARVYVETKYDVVDVKLSSPPSDSYKANGSKSLVDFVKGADRFAEGGWLGYSGEHLTATLDLGDSKPVSSVTVGALEDVGSYIFYPKGIEVLVSEDGKSYNEVAVKKIPTAPEPHTSEISNFLVDFEEVNARYVKVNILSNLVNPSWHPAPGADCWIFIDEVVVN
jgi:uncharacterized membrane protein